jgi:hypothetical protein
MNRNNNCPWGACLFTDWDELNNCYTGPSIDSSYQVFGSFRQEASEKNFRNWPTRNKNCLSRPCLLTVRDKMSNLNRRRSIAVSHQISLNVAKRLQRRRFLEIDQPETRIGYGGHACQRIGTTWTILIIHRGFLPSFTSFGKAVSEENIQMWKVKITDNRWQTPSDGKISTCQRKMIECLTI